MSLNFSSFKSISPTSSNHQLKPYTISKVKFAGCKCEDMAGKKDPTKTYKLFVTKFEGEDGNYEERTFFPDDNSAVRPTYTNQQGHEYQRPSSWEQIQGFIAKLIEVVCGKEDFEEFQKSSDKFKSFDDVCKEVIALTDKHKNEEFYLKLTGRNSNGTVYARIPNVMALNKKGELWISNNFISKNENKLAFTNYELQQQKAMAQAAPTNMDIVEDKTEDADITDLVNDL